MSAQKIAKQLIRQKEKGQSAIIFLGAGASVTAGIPTASGFVHHIQSSPKFDYLDESKFDNYFDLMENLNPGERKETLYSFIGQAKINISHLIIGFLMSEEFIDCVITTNFDPLVDDATTLFYMNPQRYDIANNVSLIGHKISFPSIIYLHGEYRNVWQLNTNSELQKKFDEVKSIISQISSKQATWIIVGYSGNDPVFDELAKIQLFEQGLFWVGYEEESPIPKVQDQLLSNPNNNAELVSGYNSDTFFEKLFKNLIEYGELDIDRINNKLSTVLFSHEQLKVASINKRQVYFSNQISLTQDCVEWIKNITKIQTSGLLAEENRDSLFEKLKKGLSELFTVRSKEIRKIISLVTDKHFEEALKLCEKEIKNNSQSVLGYYYKGVSLGEIAGTEDDPKARAETYEKMNEAFAQAKEVAEKAENTPGEVERIDAVRNVLWQTEHNRAIEYVQDDSLKGTVDNPILVSKHHLQNAIIIQPDSALSWNVLSQVAGMNQDFEDAANAKKHYIEMVPDTNLEPNDYMQLASYYFQLEDEEQVIQALEAGNEQFLEHEEIISNLADAYQRAGESDRAISTVQRLVEKDPENPQYRLVLGTQIYQQVLVLNDSLSSNTDQIFELRDKLNGASDSEANQIKQQISFLEQENEQLRAQVEELTDRAETELQQVLEQRPNDASAYNTLGIIYQNKAKAIFDKRNNTEDNAKAVEFDKQGKELLEESMGYYEKATEIEPDNQEYWQRLFSIYTTLGMDTKAQKALDKMNDE